MSRHCQAEVELEAARRSSGTCQVRPGVVVPSALTGSYDCGQPSAVAGCKRARVYFPL